MTRKTIIAIYIRVSTQEQAKEGYSIEEQKERLEKYAEAHDWIVYKVYSDPGFSGGSMDRPGLKALIRDTIASKLDKIVVYKLDRLSRSQKDTLYLIEDIFLENNVDFVSMTENFDTSTPFGKAMIGILSVFAQLEREQIKERMALGREGRAKSGLWGGGANVPIGYRYANNTLTVDPYEALAVKRIFKEYLSGKTITSIARDLKADGIRSSYGYFTRTTVYQVLNRGIYAGYIKHGENFYPGTHEKIIEVADWQKARDLLAASADTDTNHLNFSKRISIVTGLVYCGKCKKKMITAYNYYGRSRDKSKGYKKYFTCPQKSKTHCTNRRYKMEEIENLVLKEIKKLRLDPEYLKAVRSNTEESSRNEEIEILTDRIRANEGKISRLMDLYAIGGMDINQVKEKIETISQESESLKIQVDELTRKGKDILSDEEIIQSIDTMEMYIDEEDVERTRKIVTLLIKKIEVNGDNMRIYWTF